MKPKKYRKKPHEVEAVQFVGGSSAAAPIVKWILSHGGWASYETVNMDTVQGFIGIETLEGRMHASSGDFIIRGAMGEFYPCKPDVFYQTYEMPPPVLSPENRRIIEQAYDDGDGNTVAIASNDDYPWFSGFYDGQEMIQGLEHHGTLYSVVHASGGGLVSVVVGRGLVENEMGVVFHSVAEAKAYVQGLTEK